MVPAEELNRLFNCYQGKITESALLNKAKHVSTKLNLVETCDGFNLWTLRSVAPIAILNMQNAHFAAPAAILDNLNSQSEHELGEELADTTTGKLGRKWNSFV